MYSHNYPCKSWHLLLHFAAHVPIFTPRMFSPSFFRFTPFFPPFHTTTAAAAVADKTKDGFINTYNSMRSNNIDYWTAHFTNHKPLSTKNTLFLAKSTNSQGFSFWLKPQTARDLVFLVCFFIRNKVFFLWGAYNFFIFKKWNHLQLSSNPPKSPHPLISTTNSRINPNSHVATHHRVLHAPSLAWSLFPQLTEADQELYKNFPLVVSERWQEEIAETVFDYINQETDKLEQKRKQKVIDELEDDCKPAKNSCRGDVVACDVVLCLLFCYIFFF